MANENNNHDELSVAYALTNLGAQQQTTQGLFFNQLQALPRPNNIHLNFPQLAATQTLQSRPTPVAKNKCSGLKRNFPQKLFDILSNGLHEEILHWTHDGMAFIIEDKRRFMNEILPHYFKESQYTSFTRKLSRWKFTRISRGAYMGGYFHKLFARNKRPLCRFMSCNNDNTIKVDIKADTAVASLLPLTSDSQNESNKSTVEVKTSSSSAEEAFKVQQTNQNILQIKERLMQLRMEKARLRHLRRQVIIQAETERLQKLQFMRQAINNSLSQTKVRLLYNAVQSLNYNKVQPSSSSKKDDKHGAIRAPMDSVQLNNNVANKQVFSQEESSSKNGMSHSGTICLNAHGKNQTAVLQPTPRRNNQSNYSISCRGRAFAA